MKLEVCANSFESALVAQECGADRIELCQNLSVGGVTPSLSLLEKVFSEIKIPVFVLIRPRSGDFTYSDVEFERVLNDIAIAREAGAQGIVCGVLKRDHTIDVPKLEKLLEASQGLPFTFHRAFDLVSNPADGLEKLIGLGVERVLTSGQMKTVDKGFENLNALKHQSKDRIIILPGGGVSLTNSTLFKKNGFKEIHGSFQKNIKNSIGKTSSKIANTDTEDHQITSKEIVQKILKQIRT